MTREECLTIVTALCAAYPREMQEATLGVYVDDLRDCDPTALMAAVVTLRRTSKWLPSLAEIRGAMAEADTRFPTAAGAFDQAVRLMASRGTYRPIGRGSGDPVVRALELCGRWEDVCQEDTTWLRKRYVEIYDGLVAEARQGLAAGDPPPWLALPERQERPALPAPIRMLPRAARLNAIGAARG